MRRTRRTLVGLSGIAATLLLHSLLFVAATWDGGEAARHPKLPDAVGGGANTGSSEGESTERQVMVLLTPEFSEREPLAEPAPYLPEPVMQQPSIVAITGLDALPPPVIRIEAPGEDSEDQEAQLLARAKFAGIYESQIRARIERAWTLPELPEGGFSCHAQVRLRVDGKIEEVALDLTQCEGTPAMQQSLVNAIFLASPLPAPPHPSVFVDRFAMVFHSDDLVRAGQVAKR